MMPIWCKLWNINNEILYNIKRYTALIKGTDIQEFTNQNFTQLDKKAFLRINLKIFLSIIN